MALLNDMIDCHLHHKPDVMPRKQWASELMEDGRKWGMGGFVLKSHHANTAGVARQLRELFPKSPEPIGAVCLNAAVGGLNPLAVRMAGQFGARMAWLPTVSAANHLEMESRSPTLVGLRNDSNTEPLTILDADGAVLPVMGSILEEAMGKNMGIATGHLAPRETLALVEYAYAGGFPMDRLLITHPDSPVTRFTLEEQKHIASRGARLERVLMLMLSFRDIASPDALLEGYEFNNKESALMPHDLGLQGMLDQIREVGIESSLLSTDIGQAGNPDAIPSIERGLEIMAELGYQESEIRKMTVDAPRGFLGM